ncbi:MAG: hypothetical protein WCR20_14900 [Verrucomicrobiota bacterium]
MNAEPIQPSEETKLILAILHSLKAEVLNLKSKAENPSLSREEREADLARLEDIFNDLVKEHLIKSVFH